MSIFDKDKSERDDSVESEVEPEAASEDSSSEDDGEAGQRGALEVVAPLEPLNSSEQPEEGADGASAAADADDGDGDGAQDAPEPDGSEESNEESDESSSESEDADSEDDDAAGDDASEGAGDEQPAADEGEDDTAVIAEEPVRKRGKHAAPEGERGNSGSIGVIEADADRPGYVASFGEIPKKRRHRGLKAFGITVGVLAVVVLAAYIAGAVVFTGRMLPNTVIGDYDVSLRADEEVEQTLNGIVEGYQLDVIGGGFAYRTTGADIGMAIDSPGIVSAIHDELNAWAWPALVIQGVHDETDLLAITFDKATYEPAVTAEVGTFNEAAAPPTNATIAYDEKKAKFVVEPEKPGTQLDVAAVLAAMEGAIGELEPKVRIGDDELVQPTVRADDEKLVEAAELASGMVSADLTLLMGGKPVADVNGEALSGFITIDENLQVIFREEEMNEWVSALADGFNTVGTERSYTRADGKQVTVPAGGVYGWEVDTEALKGAVLEGIKAGSAANIDVPCIDTAAVYNGVGERDWGNRYIDVDLSEQHVRYYGDDGAIIWEADCISGKPDGSHNTVPGTWYVNGMESPSKLIGYENGKKIYETTVTYWMPFEGNGIGFHDATWQPSFGGSMYADGYGSHGCVNLSYDAAQSLYGIIKVGDPVVVHY